MIQREPYSYRQDPSVPAFPDDQPVVVYDGVCVLCDGWVRFVLARDAEARFVVGQSEVGQALFRHYGMDAVRFESWLLIADGAAYAEMGAVSRLIRRWGLGWRLMARVMDAMPRRASAWVYQRFALNRYRIFGRRKTCAAPAPEVRGRFIAWD